MKASYFYKIIITPYFSSSELLCSEITGLTALYIFVMSGITPFKQIDLQLCKCNQSHVISLLDTKKDCCEQ